MNSIRLIGAALFVLLAVPTVMAIRLDGSGGFPEAITYNLTSFQIWLDLVIAVLFWCAWLIRDAQLAGRNPWPWIVAALAVGCFAPLAYMIAYRRWPASPVAQAPDAGSDNRRKTGAWVGLILLAIVTVAALATDGTDIAASVMRTWSNFQIWLDLVIAIVLWLVWMVQDARKHGRSPWGWIVFALILGSFAPLVYLIVTGRWPASHPKLEA